MKCIRCGTEMTIGQAIKPGRNSCFGVYFDRLVDKDTLKIIDCFKCPKCGHSDDGTGPDEISIGV